MLVVAWKLNAENLGFFKFSEWSTGMGSMQYVISNFLLAFGHLDSAIPVTSTVNTNTRKEVSTPVANTHRENKGKEGILWDKIRQIKAREKLSFLTPRGKFDSFPNATCRK